MNTSQPRGPADLAELAKGTRFESIARDRRKLQDALLSAMKTSDDPMTREIGTGIANGTMTWRTLATNPAYREYVDRSMEAMRNLDFDKKFEALTDERAAGMRVERREVGNEEPDDPVHRPVLRKRRT